MASNHLCGGSENEFASCMTSPGWGNVMKPGHRVRGLPAIRCIQEKGVWLPWLNFPPVQQENPRAGLGQCLGYEKLEWRISNQYKDWQEFVFR